MKAERILNALGQVEDKYVKEAEPASKAPKRPALRKWGSIAACLLLVAAACFGLRSPDGSTGVSAYAYGAEEEITAAGVITSTGTISNSGEMTGHPLMFFLTGEDIESVRFSCKNQQLNFVDWTEKRDEFGTAQNFTVPYGENAEEYYFLTIDWVPNATIRALTDRADSTIATLPTELREDVIVMEITFLSGKTETKAIHITLQEDGSFFAAFDDYSPTAEDEFVLREDAETVPKDILYGKTEMTITFLDEENNEVAAEALWYNMAQVAQISVKWSGATPDTVQAYYTPSGTETIDQIELLCTKAVWGDQSEVVFSAEELGFAERNSVHGHLQIDLGFGKTKTSSKLYNVFYDLTA